MSSASRHGNESHIFDQLPPSDISISKQHDEPLPTKDEYMTRLRLEITLASCPICYRSAQVSHTTGCDHTFCVQDLVQWFEKADHCPLCRLQLFEKPPEVVADWEDVEPVDIPRLDLPFAVDNDLVNLHIERVIKHVRRAISRDNDDEDHDVEGAEGNQGLGYHDGDADNMADQIKVYYSEIIDLAAASIFMTRMTSDEEARTDSELCTAEWIEVAVAIREVLLSLDGKIVTCGQLQKALGLRAQEKVCGGNLSWPDYGADVDALGRSFKDDVDLVVDRIVAYTTSVHGYACGTWQRTSLLARGLRWLGISGWVLEKLARRHRERGQERAQAGQLVFFGPMVTDYRGDRVVGPVEEEGDGWPWELQV